MPPPKKTLTVHLIGILETAGLRVSDQVCGKYIHSHKSKEKLKNKSEVEQDGKGALCLQGRSVPLSQQTIPVGLGDLVDLAWLPF